jgi:hypothetical protein
MLSKDSVVSESKKNEISEGIRKSIRHLKINYIKDITNYIDFCNQNEKVVKWFTQIDDIKFSVASVTPACLTNVILNFHDKVGDSIEVRSNAKANKLQVEAKGCFIMLLYVGADDNSSK